MTFDWREKKKTEKHKQVVAIDSFSKPPAQVILANEKPTKGHPIQEKERKFNNKIKTFA